MNPAISLQFITIYYVLISYPLPRTYFRLESCSRERVKSFPCRDKVRRKEKNREDSFNMNWYHQTLDLQMFEPDSSVEYSLLWGPLSCSCLKETFVIFSPAAGHTVVLTSASTR